MKLLRTIPAFPVHRIDDAAKFYETKLGFTCLHKDNAFAILIRDTAEIHLWVSDDNSWKWRRLFFLMKPIRSGAESFLAGTHSCRIEVEDIEKLYSELKQQEVLYNSRTVIEKTDWGTREFATLDLHHNLLTFYERA